MTNDDAKHRLERLFELEEENFPAVGSKFDRFELRTSIVESENPKQRRKKNINVWGATTIVNVPDSESREEKVAKKTDIQKGTIKWLNIVGGFGFIQRDKGDDVFMHFSPSDAKVRSLKKGLKVCFSARKTIDGLETAKVVLVKSAKTGGHS